MSEGIFILLVTKYGRKKKDKKLTIRSNSTKVELLAGTLLKVITPTNSHEHSYEGELFESIDTADVVEVSCRASEVSQLQRMLSDLLRPIPTCLERLDVYKNKEWVQEGLLLKPGESVFVKIKGHHTELPGIIRYRGHLPETPGVYFGIELTENKGEGQTDGVYRKKRYFTTETNCAVFCPIHKIRKRRESWQRSDRARVGQESTMSSQPLNIGDRVMWPSDNGNEFGTVRWIGRLPDDTSGDITVGVEFDNPIGSGTGKYKDHRLFYTKHGHASLVPLMGLLKVDEAISPFPEGQEFLKQQEEILRHCQSSLPPSSSSIPPTAQPTSGGAGANGFAQRTSSRPAYPSSSDVSGDLVLRDEVPEVMLKKPVEAVQVEKESEINNGIQQLVLKDTYGEESGLNPLYLYSKTQESCDRSRDSKQSSASNSVSSGTPDQDLTVGSMVEVLGKPPLYGVIKWIGNLEGQTKIIAGLEMEEETSAGTDGTFRGLRLFTCAPQKALFVPLNKCRKDKRFLAEAKERSSLEGFGTVETPDVDGDICPPEVVTETDLEKVCGMSRGIQGHHNSCYLDATLFAMFYFTTVFDFIFNEPPRHDSVPQHLEVQKVLKEGIVNPLRRFNYVRADKVLKLRALLDRLGTIPGMMGEEKDPEEFLSALLSQIMKADPLLHLSSGEHSYFYQLFLEKDEKLLLPTTQTLVELSFLQGNVKLKEVPSCLIIQMPRFGKDYKMYRRIIPSLELDITDILETGIRECIVCGGLAMYECKDCYRVHGQGLNTTAFCETCIKTSHQHKMRQGHNPKQLLHPPQEFLPRYAKMREDAGMIMKQNGEPLSTHDIGLPREKLELFAVVCIQTSHYVCFVKCGMGKDAHWVFFDSMADRMGEQGGYNIPEVQHVPELSKWLSCDNFEHILSVEDDKNLPEHVRRLLCDAYMCMYQSPSVMMFR